MAELKQKSLLEFLSANRVDGIRKEIELSAPRLKGYKFVIRPITAKEFNEIEAVGVSYSRSGKQSVRSDKITEMLFSKAVIEPDFTDNKWLQSIGANTVIDAISIVLFPGEVAELSSHIMEISGLNVDMDSMVDEAKNE